ncbi:hypothetical protein ACTXT7_012111 [Hymenolepis weldensis]
MWTTKKNNFQPLADLPPKGFLKQRSFSQFSREQMANLDIYSRMALWKKLRGHYVPLPHCQQPKIIGVAGNFVCMHNKDTRSSPNIQEINPAKLLTKESLSTHRQNVSAFVSRFLNEMVKQSISQPTGKQKITSGENQCPIHSTKSDVIIKKQIKIDQGGSKSKGKEPKNLHYNRMPFSIDTLVKSGKDSENLS